MSNPKMNGAYINGLDDPTTLAKTIEAAATKTGTTDFILFSLTVHDKTGDIYYGLGPNRLATGGAITSNVGTLLAPVVAAGVDSGSCTRVWLSLGGAVPSGVESTFSYISTILGSATEGALISNLNAIASALQKLSSKITSVGFDLDIEDGPISTAASLVNLLCKDQSYPITFCPYSQEQDWLDALSTIYGTLGHQPVVGMNLQVYAGGYGNEPEKWTAVLADYMTKNSTDVPSAEGFIWPIQSLDPLATPTATPAQMQSNLEKWHSKGGSFWATQSLGGPPAPSWSDYASAIQSGCSG